MAGTQPRAASTAHKVMVKIGVMENADGEVESACTNLMQLENRGALVCSHYSSKPILRFQFSGGKICIYMY